MPNYHTHFESSSFEVKDPSKFEKDFKEKIKGEDSTCYLHMNEARILGTDLWVGGADDDFCDTSEDSIAYFLQEYIQDGADAQLTCINSSSKITDLFATVYHITSMAVGQMNLDDSYNLLKQITFPKWVECKSTMKSPEMVVWIEKGKRYKALEQRKLRNRQYFTIQHAEGAELTWGKEHFYE